ncbi:uncharacterized protein LOC109829637 [Asparagus officinalis]|uniref:uncharacterized protein LOC109829637 n=1 Tax=Asparagus officinalis TaxID=4686 RepID=UPI00098E1DF5|nr:uncharacterized protein LOC109829637 [Asparagus officinalis]
MLAALGKDSLLSVRGVCALYRRQSLEEKFAQRALERNNKGFSIADVKLASCYAKFMLGEQTQGDIQRSVRELDRRYPYASDRCITISMRYSKQLFSIYEKEEDQYFHP